MRIPSTVAQAAVPSIHGPRRMAVPSSALMQVSCCCQAPAGRPYLSRPRGPPHVVIRCGFAPKRQIALHPPRRHRCRHCRGLAATARSCRTSAPVAPDCCTSAQRRVGNLPGWRERRQHWGSPAAAAPRRGRGQCDAISHTWTRWAEEPDATATAVKQSAGSAEADKERPRSRHACPRAAPQRWYLLGRRERIIYATACRPAAGSRDPSRWRRARRGRGRPCSSSH